MVPVMSFRRVTVKYMIRAGQSPVVKNIALPRPNKAKYRRNVAVFAQTYDRFMGHFSSVQNGAFEGRTFVTDEVVYRLCDKQQDAEGIEFSSAVTIGAWYVGLGGHERSRIMATIRKRAAMSGATCEGD